MKVIHKLRPRYNINRFLRFIIGGTLDKFNKAKNWLDRLRLKSIVGEIGWKSKIHEGVMLIGYPSNIKIGKKVYIYHRVVLTVGENGRIEIGDWSHLGVGAYLNASAGQIRIGKGTSIGALTQVYSYATVIPKDRESSFKPSHRVADVTIGDFVHINSCSTILPGVTIGDGAVIGAGSLVTDDVPPYTTVIGVPARKIFKKLNQDI